MGKIELLGVVTACVFALLGFSESGIVAMAGTGVFAAAAAMMFSIREQNKKRKFAACKKALIRRRVRI